MKQSDQIFDWKGKGFYARKKDSRLYVRLSRNKLTARRRASEDSTLACPLDLQELEKKPNIKSAEDNEDDDCLTVS